MRRRNSDSSIRGGGGSFAREPSEEASYCCADCCADCHACISEGEIAQGAVGIGGPASRGVDGCEPGREDGGKGYGATRSDADTPMLGYGCEPE